MCCVERRLTYTSSMNNKLFSYLRFPINTETNRKMKTALKIDPLQLSLIMKKKKVRGYVWLHWYNEGAASREGSLLKYTKTENKLFFFFLLNVPLQTGECLSWTHRVAFPAFDMPEYKQTWSSQVHVCMCYLISWRLPFQSLPPASQRSKKEKIMLEVFWKIDDDWKKGFLEIERVVCEPKGHIYNKGYGTYTSQVNYCNIKSCMIILLLQ